MEALKSPFVRHHEEDHVLVIVPADGAVGLPEGI
jgi:hypothetical protein